MPTIDVTGCNPSFDSKHELKTKGELDTVFNSISALMDRGGIRGYVIGIKQTEESCVCKVNAGKIKAKDQKFISDAFAQATQAEVSTHTDKNNSTWIVADISASNAYIFSGKLNRVVKPTLFNGFKKTIGR